MYFDLVFTDSVASLSSFAKPRKIQYLVTQSFPTPTACQSFSKKNSSFFTCHLLNKIDTREIQSFSNAADFVAVKGGTLEKNFTAVTTKGVDFLLNSFGSGVTFDAAMANRAKENKTAIVFMLSEIWESKNPVAVLKHYRQLAIICKKKKVPFLVATGAKDESQLRNPLNLSSVGALLDAPEPTAISWVKSWENCIQLKTKKAVTVVNE